MDLIALATIVISLVALIVFFIMSSNVGTLVQLGRKQSKQNDEIIRLLKGDNISDKEPLKSKTQLADDAIEKAKRAL